MDAKNVLLLVGSPKGFKSTSCAVGNGLAERLEKGGLTVERMAVGSALTSDDAAAGMQRAVENADVIILSFPLYVDQLPAPLIRAAELIAAYRGAHPPLKPQKLMAIVQCGFPETHQNKVAGEIVRRFAKEAGFEWAGALAMGMGGAVAGRPLEKAGGVLRNVVKALDLTAGALLAGKSVPDDAAKLMAKPFLPRWTYTLIGNWGFKREARKHGASRKLYDRPYA